jgi:hypothetical protein
MPVDISPFKLAQRRCKSMRGESVPVHMTLLLLKSNWVSTRVAAGVHLGLLQGYEERKALELAP